MLKKFWMGIVTILCAIAITITINYAWFVSGYDVDPLATGSSVDAYYLKGSGTELDPYIITTPRHLYNLAWLQYLGTYNKPSTQGGTAYESTYFKLGTTANGTLNMTGWPLPPIGTAKYPFIGNFNGNGWTISNLTTTNNFTEFGDKHPSGISADGANGTDAFEQANCGTIGFFGAIGAYNNSVISDTVTTSTEGVSYPTTTNTATNFYLNNTHVHTGTSETIIGAVAGYVNATLSQVGVIQPHLNIQTSASAKLGTNLSDFAVVGYAESQYTTQKTKSSTIIYNPTYNLTHFNFKGMGSQSDWGGSIAMYDLNLRNKAFYDYATNGSSISYTDKEFKVVNGNNISRTVLSTDTDGDDSKGYKYINAEDYNSNLGAESGSYLLVHEARYTYAPYGTNQNGESHGDYSYSFLTAVYKDVIELTISDEEENGFKIKSGDVFLNRNSSAISDESGETVWRIDNSNHIYTYVYDLDVYGNNFNNTSTTNQYYLNATTTTLSLGTTGTTSWSWDSTHNTYVFTSGNNHYGIIYNNGWKVECVDLYKIHDGNGNYLSVNNSGVITNTNETNATTWIFSNYSGTGTISTVINGTSYYLYLNNGSLTTSTSGSTNWTRNNNGELYNGANYIQYRQTSNGVYQWIASFNTSVSICYITDNNGNYLSLDNSGNIVNQSNVNNATMWAFTTMGNNPSGYIYATVSGTTYYLSYNNGLTTQTTQTTSWSNAGSGLYYSGNYIQFRDGKWIASTDTTTSTRYRITDGNGNYLSINGTNIVNETNESDAIGWTFSNTGNNPSGTISTIINGTTYYLRDNNGLELSTTSTTWSNVGSGIYSGTNYIRYTGEMWTSTSSTSETRYYISSGSNYLSVSGTSLTNVTQQANATKWVFSNYNGTGTISTKINGTTYYLHLNGSTLELSNTSTNWTSDANGHLSYNYNYIQYTNSTWIASNHYYYISYNGYYLSHNNNNLTQPTNQSDATLWYFSNGGANPSGTIRDLNYDNNRYIRRNNSNTVQYSTTNSNNSSSYNGTSLTIGNRYLYYDNGWKTNQNTSYQITLTAPSVTLTSSTLNYSNSQVSNSYTSTYVRSYIVKSFDSIYNATTTNTYTKNFGVSKVESEIIEGVATNVTTYPVSRAVIEEPSAFSYIPLNVDENYKVTDTNTGYFVGGGHESSYQEDVRFAAYPASNISSSYSYNNGNGSFSTIYTVNDSTSRVAINDSNSGFVKYTESRRTLLDTLNDSGNRVYGVHFMNATITKDTVITAPKVLFNDNQENKIKYNFEMPEDSIDFYLKSKGYINFFAGYYFDGQGGTNSSFFSLHQIERDKYNRIIAFNHITGVYQKDNASPYVYSLDGAGAGRNYSSVDSDGKIVYYSDLPSGYNKVFNSSWIESPCMGANKDSYLYYFEIPVNSGEFALGSVNGKAGAYLLYLDIGANATAVDRTEIMQQSTRSTQDLTYVKGIQLLETGSTYTSDENSCVAIIPASQTGTFNFSRSGNVITTPTLDSTYYDENLTCQNLSITVTPVTITTKVLKYIDYTSDNKLYHTTVKDVDGVQTFETRLINNNDNPVIVTNATPTEEQKTAAYGLLKPDDAGYGVIDTAASAMTAHASSFSTTAKILDYYFFVPTSQKNSIVESIEMKVEQVANNESITLGSFVVTNGTYSFGGYTSTHCYKLVGNDINLQPNGLIVYIGPTYKNGANITLDSNNHIASVVTTFDNNTPNNTSDDITYTFTFNASAIVNTAKTITIYYVAPE